MILEILIYLILSVLVLVGINAKLKRISDTIEKEKDEEIIKAYRRELKKTSVFRIFVITIAFVFMVFFLVILTLS